MSIKIACVQLDFSPAFFDEGRYYIVDDAFFPPSATVSTKNPLELLTDFLQDHTELIKSIIDWKEQIRKSYLKHYEQKLKVILRECQDRKARIVVFPEYSIPAELLPTVKKYSKGGYIFAGTHTLNSHFDKIYREISIDFEEEDELRSACIIFHNETTLRIDKMGRSHNEPNLKVGRKWQPLEFDYVQSGVKMKMICLICSDFLSPPDRAKKFTNGTLSSENNYLFIIPANTRIGDRVYDMEIKVADLIERKIKRGEHHAIYLLANGAMYGGTRIYFHNRDLYRSELANQLGFIPVPPREEAILFCELDNDIWARPITGFSPTNVARFPFHSFEPLPLVYRNARYDVLSFLKDIRLYDQQDFDLKKVVEQLAYYQKDIPGLMQEKLNTLCRSMAQARGAIRRLTSFCDMGIQITIDEWRFQVAIATYRFVESLSSKVHTNDRGLSEQLGNVACRLYKLAESYAKTLRIDYISDLLQSISNPGDFLDESLPLATRILGQPSSGIVSSELTNFVRESLRQTHGEEDTGIKNRVLRVSKIVSDIRPLPVKPLADKIKESIKGQEASHVLLQKLDEHIDQKLKQTKDLFAHLNQNPIFSQKDRLLIYGYSEVLVGLFESLDSEMRDTIKIYISECPNRLGKDSGPLQASKLRNLGFRNVFFVHKTSVYRCLKDDGISKVLMGANFLSKEFIVNTVGSMAVVKLANDLEVPIYLVAPRYKIWPADIAESIPIMDTVGKRHRPKWSPGEEMLSLYPSPGKNNEIINYAYDTILFNEISFIITDKGVFAANDFMKKVALEQC